jgi:lactate dehydrogenase-like 2-hydroxyacid dehydrogenase
MSRLDALPRAFVTRRIPDEGMRLIAAAARAEVWPDELPPPYETLGERVADCEGLLCLLTDRVDAALLDRAPRLRVVSQLAVGYDNIDIDACSSRGIRVGNTPGVLTETTADLAFSLIMATARRIVESDRVVREGRWLTWSPLFMAGVDIHHAVLGIVGMGRIGYEVARRARGFQMTVLYSDERPSEAAEHDFGAQRVPLDELLRQSDFVTIHTPLLPETTHLIGARELGLMKQSAILVNTARGPIVDQCALYEALVAREIGGAGLDVFEKEPVATDEPLLKLDNVVVLPHIGSASIATRTRMAVIAARNLVAGLNVEPLPHAVN